MKKYRIEYRDIKTSPYRIEQISKSMRVDGMRIIFYNSGIKFCQIKCKNNLRNGMYKLWNKGKTNVRFKNIKKETAQGINIRFKTH